jgi:hypothetical protein
MFLSDVVLFFSDPKLPFAFGILRCPFFRRFLGIKCEYYGPYRARQGLGQKALPNAAASECLCTRAQARDDEVIAFSTAKPR